MVAFLVSFSSTAERAKDEDGDDAGTGRGLRNHCQGPILPFSHSFQITRNFSCLGLFDAFFCHQEIRPSSFQKICCKLKARIIGTLPPPIEYIHNLGEGVSRYKLDS